MITSPRLAAPLTSHPWPRMLAAVGGVGFALCMVGGAALSTETLAYLPAPDDIVAAYAGDTARILVATYLVCFGALFLAAHGVGVGALVGADDGQAHAFGTLALAGGLIAATLVLVAASATFASVERAAATGIPAGAAVALSDFNGVLLGKAMPMSFALLVGATVAGTRRRAMLPGWLRWAGAVLAVGLMSPFMWAFVVLVVAWAPLVGFLLGRSSERHQPADQSLVADRTVAGSAR